MLQLLSALRHKCAIGFVGGSDLVKQQEQLGTPSIPVTGLFDFCFAENGLTAYRLGKQLASTSFIGWLGQEKYKQLVNFCLRYIADIDIPVKTGTFVEFRYFMVSVAPLNHTQFSRSWATRGMAFSSSTMVCINHADLYPLCRNGMINVSPVGRNASIQERHDYEKYDLQHKIRASFVEALKAKFPDFGLTYV